VREKNSRGVDGQGPPPFRWGLWTLSFPSASCRPWRSRPSGFSRRSLGVGARLHQARAYSLSAGLLSGTSPFTTFVYGEGPREIKANGGTLRIAECNRTKGPAGPGTRASAQADHAPRRDHRGPRLRAHPCPYATLQVSAGPSPTNTRWSGNKRHWPIPPRVVSGVSAATVPDFGGRAAHLISAT
jgi:hypothetical protein